MIRRAFGITLLITMFSSLVGEELRAASPKGALLLPMLEILKEANVTGSLELSDRCSEGYPPDFPPFQTPATRREYSTLQSLREILRDDHAIRTRRESAGRIRMIENAVPTDVLDLRLRHISFNGTFQTGPQGGVYSPNEALEVILNAPELVAFVKAREITVLGVSKGIGGGGRWPSDSPHISGSLDNVTLSQALDRVLETFPGIWVYQNCPREDNRQRVVYFRFFYLRNIGAGVFVEG